jgi:hypothetical protein
MPIRETGKTMPQAAQQALAAVEADRRVVCTMEEYSPTVRVALQRYAMAQAAQGHPELMGRADAEIQRLDAAQARGRWPGTYSSRWEHVFVWIGRRYATRILVRRYYRRALRRTPPPWCVSPYGVGIGPERRRKYGKEATGNSHNQ